MGRSCLLGLTPSSHPSHYLVGGTLLRLRSFLLHLPAFGLQSAAGFPPLLSSLPLGSLPTASLKTVFLGSRLRTALLALILMVLPSPQVLWEVVNSRVTSVPPLSMGVPTLSWEGYPTPMSHLQLSIFWFNGGSLCQEVADGTQHSDKILNN